MSAQQTLILKNQFGEESINHVLGGTFEGAGDVASGTVLANITGSPAIPSPTTLQSLSTVLPPKLEVAAITALATPVAAITVATAGGNTYTDAAINAALASVVADLQSQLTQMNAMLSAMKQTS